MTGAFRNLTLGDAARQAGQGAGCPCGEPSLGRRHWPWCHNAPGTGGTAWASLGIKTVLPSTAASQSELEFPPTLGSEAAGFGQRQGSAQQLTHGGCWGHTAGTFPYSKFQLFSKTLFRVKAKT